MIFWNPIPVDMLTENDAKTVMGEKNEKGDSI